MNLIDIGVNLTSNRFHNIDSIIQDAKRHNVKYILGISNSVLDIEKNLETCKRNDNVYCTAGVHPHQVKYLNDERFANLEKFIKNNDGTILAVGECGLDYDRNFSKKKDQIKWFKKQLDLAASYNFPVYLHQRESHDDFTNILKSHYYDFSDKAIVHCFTGGWEELKTYLEMGYYIGITGWICDDKRSEKLTDGLIKVMKDDVLRDTFLTRLMTETDSPWLPPNNPDGSRPKNNYPKNVKSVVDKLSDILGIPQDKVIELSHSNFKRFFKIK